MAWRPASGRTVSSIGQIRAEGEAHGELGGPAAHAEHDAGLLAGERTIGVAGIGEGGPNDLESDQLSGLDRREARRGHPVANRVERDVGKKPAPLGDDLVGSLGIGVVIEPPVPAVGWDFDDGIEPLERIGPEARSRRRAGQHGGHADDGDVGWLGRGLGSRWNSRRPGESLVHEIGARSRQLVVQAGHRGGLAAQSGDLAEHVEAVGCLVVVASGSSFEPRSLERSRPLVATRRRPTFKPSRASRISSVESPSAWSRARSCSKRATKGVGLTRTWWPGPDSSRTVVSQRRTSSWKRGTMAPVATASRVKR